MVYDPTFTVHLVGYMLGLLVLIGIVSMVWLRLSFGVLGYIVKKAHQLGLYNPTPSTERSAPSGAIPRDRTFIMFSRALRFISKLVPGDPSTSPRAVIIPLLLLGLPITMAVIVLLWAIPLLIFSRVIGTVSGSWAMYLAYLSLFAYISVLLISWRFARSHAPTTASHVRNVLDWR